jgi:WD40 repeat protein
MRLSPDGSVLARARNDGPIDLWDVPSGRWIDQLDSGTTAYAVIDFSPDGRTLVARHREKCVLWDVQTRQLKRTATAPNAYPTVCYSPDGTVIAHGVGASRIQFFDAHTGHVISENNAFASAGLGMVFHPGGSVFFASGINASIRLWDSRTARELLSLEKHTTLIRTLLLTPDGNTLISSDDWGMVLAWDLAYYNERIRRGSAPRRPRTRDTVVPEAGSGQAERCGVGGCAVLVAKTGA